MDDLECMGCGELVPFDEADSHDCVTATPPTPPAPDAVETALRELDLAVAMMVMNRTDPVTFNEASIEAVKSLRRAGAALTASRAPGGRA